MTELMKRQGLTKVITIHWHWHINLCDKNIMVIDLIFIESRQIKIQGITKDSKFYPLGAMNICTTMEIHQIVV